MSIEESYAWVFAGAAMTVISGAAFLLRKLYLYAQESQSSGIANKREVDSLHFTIAKLELAMHKSESIEKMNLEEIRVLSAANASLEKALRAKEAGAGKLRHIEFEGADDVGR